MPVAVQRQTLMVQTIQKTMEIPQQQCVDKVVDDPVVSVPQVVEKMVQTPVIQTVKGTQTSESLGTAPVSQAAQVEIVEAVEIGAPIPADSGPPMFVKVLEIPVVVEHVQRGSNTYRCFSGPSDHIESGADSLPNYSADRHGTNRHCDSVEDTPLAQQSLSPTAQTVQKTANVPQMQYNDKVVEVPVVMQRPDPILQTVQKTTEVPQCTDKAVDVPGLTQRQIPFVQRIQKMVEVARFSTLTRWWTRL